MRNEKVKYRIFDKELNEMININRIDIGDGSCSPGIFCGKLYDYWNDVELMQYTGFKDKNSVDIFENDICKIHYSATSIECLVFFNNCTNSIMVIDDSGHEYDLYKLCKYYDIEVIGNIYQNQHNFEKKYYLEGINNEKN